MQISSVLKSHLVLADDTIAVALAKINENKARVVFVVTEGGYLLASFSDGDFRRWVTSSKFIDLDQPVSAAANVEVKKLEITALSRDIEKSFQSGISILPLVDKLGRIQKLAFAEGRGFQFAGRRISDDASAFIIAEIGNNHNGSLALAKELVDHALEAGADCAKFQMRDMSKLYVEGKGSAEAADLGVQYTLDLLNRFQLKHDELFQVFDYCKTRGLPPLCTPWDLTSLKLLEDYGMQSYKVASADLTNHELLRALAATGKPLFCSTGMSSEIEILQSVRMLKSVGATYALLHCNSTYPTPYKDVNLNYLPRLKEIADAPVGYSGHERGIAIPVAAVVLGARIIEKHLTVDKSMEGNDHKVSLLPEELRQMVQMIRAVEQSMGVASERVISQGEMINRESLAKSLVAARTLKKGEVISAADVNIRSPGQGLQPMYQEDLVGRTTSREIEEGTFFYPSDLKDAAAAKRHYNFRRSFGIPSRYHDYASLIEGTNLDLVEFHLSYRDLELDIEKYIKGEQACGLAIHAPELFGNDHILNLASDDEAYRAHSIKELERVLDVSRKLKKFFPKTERPVVVLNAGGFSTAAFLEARSRPGLYDRVGEALKAVNTSGLEIIIQTMPPFPWHFGGQSFHNIFISADEIVQFCEKYSFRICLDVSHSMMACNYFGWDLDKFVEQVAPYIAHMHIVDALGTDGEGVQIGHGDVDFHKLAEILNTRAPEASFIPEVWQGHKNGGEGFWHALEFLEPIL